MNILREIRKIKNKNLIVKVSLVLIFSLIFIVNTYAWWNLSKEIEVNKIKGQIKPWDVEYVVDDNNIINETIKIPIEVINPGMEEFNKVIKIKNTGEKATKIKYELVSVKLFGEEKIGELSRNGEIQKNGNIVNIFTNKEKYPFNFSYTYDKTNLIGEYIDDRTTDSYANLSLHMDWPYQGTDILDTDIGKQAYNFYNLNSNKNALEIGIKITSEKNETKDIQ